MARGYSRLNSRSRLSTGGFTLLEILVVVALIGLLSTTLIVGAGRMLSEKGPGTPEEILGKAITDARQHAVVNNVEVRLAFNEEEQAFVASTSEGARTFPIDFEGELKFDFLSMQKSATAILIGGQLVETQTIKYVTFYPDGTCSPFKAQIRLGGEVTVLEIDPWTCNQVLKSKE